MSFPLHARKMTTVSTPLETQPTPNATELASLLASLKERKKEREIANRIDGELYDKLSLILKQQKKSFKNWLTEAAAKEVISFSGGNETFTLDHFQDPNFTICPSVFREYDSWKKYYSKLTKAQYQEIDQQLRMILQIHNSFYGKGTK